MATRTGTVHAVKAPTTVRSHNRTKGRADLHRLVGLLVKVCASRVVDLVSIPAFGVGLF